MWPNPQFHVDLVTFTGEILNRKLHFLCSDPSFLVVYLAPYLLMPKYGLSLHLKQNSNLSEINFKSKGIISKFDLQY